ncbi:class I SAM-dependent methyltransferase [Proteiniclasticum sp.]|uniref:class I SAM-dependent methyltransferase n=1 Tax=Proteiniclasticum sp. TaxID=2053595 RepID=UPI00289BDCAF|nr:class I SAM-dependent methyltransferase [Proteiniclasticum sp.]
MDKSKNNLFDRIAPIYGMFFNLQKRKYAFVPDMLSNEKIMPPMQVLDLGCGTGALLSVLEEAGFRVTGIDQAGEMLKVARWKTRHQEIRYVHHAEGKRLPFKDNSFDLVISSFVLHGMGKEERMGLYKEMKRISRRKVIIHDYNRNRSLPTTIIEYLENGDYFGFIRTAEEEMREVFETVTITQVGERASWYVMEADGPRITAGIE